jgi:DNA-binding transcriptional LysR family regulator
MIVMNDDIGDVARSWLDATSGDARTVLRTNGREAMAAMAAAGIGLACLPRIVGDATPGLRAVAAGPTVTALPERTLWLGVHRDARTIPRVRAVIDFLAAELPPRLRGAATATRPPRRAARVRRGASA